MGVYFMVIGVLLLAVNAIWFSFVFRGRDKSKIGILEMLVLNRVADRIELRLRGEGGVDIVFYKHYDEFDGWVEHVHHMTFEFMKQCRLRSTYGAVLWGWQAEINSFLKSIDYYDLPDDVRSEIEAEYSIDEKTTFILGVKGDVAIPDPGELWLDGSICLPGFGRSVSEFKPLKCNRAYEVDYFNERNILLVRNEKIWGR